MRILIVADSLAFPRVGKQQRYEDAWPALLQEAQPGLVVWQRARQGMTSKDAIQELHMLMGYFGDSPSFDALIVQVGIVDCCPRPLPRMVTKILPLLPGGKRVEAWLNSNYRTLLRLRAEPWISQETFAANLETLAELGTKIARRVVFVEIAPAAHHLLENIPNVTAFVERYNALLREVANAPNVSLARPYDADAAQRCMLEDGHHLTVEGHLTVAQALSGALWRAPEREVGSGHPR